MTVFLRMKKVVFLFDFNYLCVKTICSSALQWHKLVKKNCFFKNEFRLIGSVRSMNVIVIEFLNWTLDIYVNYNWLIIWQALNLGDEFYCLAEYWFLWQWWFVVYLDGRERRNRVVKNCIFLLVLKLCKLMGLINKTSKANHLKKRIAKKSFSPIAKTCFSDFAPLFFGFLLVFCELVQLYYCMSSKMEFFLLEIIYRC